jgi:hypothetical protein
MLDVHPAHHAANSWRDFFVHIATIVLGLLIAVGLEQTVEYIHNQVQVAEFRKTLATERRVNAELFGEETEEILRIAPVLATDLQLFQYLKAHPHAPESEWPGQWNTHHTLVTFRDSTWRAAEQSGVLEHMAPAEREGYASLYSRLGVLSECIARQDPTTREAAKVQRETPDLSAMSPGQVERELGLTIDVISVYEYCANIQSNMSAQFHDFPPAPPHNPFATLVPSASRSAAAVAYEKKLAEQSDAIKAHNRAARTALGDGPE